MTYESSVVRTRYIPQINMRETARNGKGTSWTSHLPSRLRLLVCRPNEERHSEGSEFRMTHVPDRPDRAVSWEAIPGDEECLQHLLAMQRREVSAREGSSGDGYGETRGDGFMCLRGVSVSGGDMSPPMGGYGVRSPGFCTGRDLCEGEAVARPVRSSLIQRDSRFMEGTVPRQQQCQHRNTETAAGPTRLFHPQTPNVSGRKVAQQPPMRGTWPAPSQRRIAGIPKAYGPWALTQPRTSVLGSAMVRSATYPDTDTGTVILTDPGISTDGDSDDDVYDGWEDYYFDEDNFYVRDGGAGKVGRDVYRRGGNCSGGLSIIDEFI